MSDLADGAQPPRLASSSTSAVTDQELATVLAALRYWANALDEQGAEFAFTYPHFFDHLPLTPGQIESLCDQLNDDEPCPPAMPEQTQCTPTGIQLHDHAA